VVRPPATFTSGRAPLAELLAPESEEVFPPVVPWPDAAWAAVGGAADAAASVEAVAVAGVLVLGAGGAA
jgi:hypothetical protein